MRVLISAYACEPGKGSEPGVGFVSALGAASEHEVWVLTRQNNVESIEGAIASHPLRSRMHVVGFDLSPTVLRLKKMLRRAGTQLYYELWQRRASDMALALDRLHDFDVLHHATFANNWTRIGVASVPKPIVVGPVGGSACTPWRLWPVLGLRGFPRGDCSSACSTSPRTPHRSKTCPSISLDGADTESGDHSRPPRC